MLRAFELEINFILVPSLVCTLITVILDAFDMVVSFSGSFLYHENFTEHDVIVFSLFCIGWHLILLLNSSDHSG